MISKNKIETRTESKSIITDQAEVILSHRYYLKDTNGDIIEDSSELFSRVAAAVAKVVGGYINASKPFIVLVKL